MLFLILVNGEGFIDTVGLLIVWRGPNMAWNNCGGVTEHPCVEFACGLHSQKQLVKSFPSNELFRPLEAPQNHCQSGHAFGCREMINCFHAILLVVLQYCYGNGWLTCFLVVRPQVDERQCSAHCSNFFQH